MILFASIVRVRDGLPLSASTDFYHAQEFLECRRQLKALAQRLAQHPGRGSAESCDFRIYFLSSGDVACMAICSRQCPAAMAFCFLEALWWDFIASYDTTCISLASRPYAFLEFDSVIQKTKWHFNHMSSSQMKSGLEKIQEELKSQPPAVVSLEGTDVANGLLNGHAPAHSEPDKRSNPGSANFARLSKTFYCGFPHLTVPRPHSAESPDEAGDSPGRPLPCS